MKPNINNDLFFQSLIDNKIIIAHLDGKVFNTLTKREVGKDKLNNYSTIGYYDGNLNHYIQKHRLIWIFFNGLIPEGLLINHIDGVKSNNCLINLELATYSENINHAISHGLVHPNISKKVEIYGYIEKCSVHKIDVEIANIIREKVKDYKRGMDSIIAKEFNISRHTVSNIRRNKAWLST